MEENKSKENVCDPSCKIYICESGNKKISYSYLWGLNLSLIPK